MIDCTVIVNIIWTDPTDWLEIDAGQLFKVLPWQARANLLVFYDLPEPILVQTSYSETSGWENVAYLAKDTAQYLDTSANNTVYLNSCVYYRLLLPESKRKTDLLKLNEDTNKIALEIARRHSILLRQGMHGSQCYAFIKYRDGVRCPSCWDEITQQRVLGNCPECNNTGWVWGFHDPIETYVSFSSNLASQQPDLEGAPSQGTKQTGWMSNYPVLSTGDIIVSSDDWEIWGVESVIQTSHKGALTKQTLNLTAYQGNAPKRAILEHIRSEII